MKSKMEELFMERAVCKLNDSLVKLRKEIEAEIKCSPQLVRKCETCTFLQGLLDIINPALEAITKGELEDAPQEEETDIMP